MADGPGDWVIEIRRGTSAATSLTLTRGTPVQPMSIGLRSDWRIEADGVFDIHAYICFDGEQLFVQSTDQGGSVRVNGEPIDNTWSPVSPPCTLAMGDARLIYCAATEAAGAVSVRPAAGGGRPAPQPSARISPPTSPPNAGPARPPPRRPSPVRAAPIAPHDFDGAQDDETTRALPVANFSAVRNDDRTGDIPLPPAYRESHDRPGTPLSDGGDEPTSVLPLPTGMPAPFASRPAPPPPPRGFGTPPAMTSDVQMANQFAPPPYHPQQHAPMNVPPPVETGAPRENKAAKLLGELKVQWKEASLPKKAIVALLPIAFIFVIIGFSEDEPKRRTAVKPKPSASVVASSEPEVDDEPRPKAKKDKDKNPTTVATKSTSTGGTSPSVISATPTLTASSTLVATPTVESGKKTAERAAVDAVAAGSYEVAAGLYAALAESHPDNPAYREAARILRAKASSSPRK